MTEPIKIVYYPAPERAFTPEQVMDVMARHAGNDDIVMVMRFLLQQRLAVATATAAEAKLTEREAGHAGGRIEELTNFQWQITQLIEATRERRGKKK